MGQAGSYGVFISYRRGDRGDAAGRLRDRLVDHFGTARVFMDVHDVEPGMDYVEEIVRRVDACGVLVTVIGPGWLSAADARSRRLDNPEDWVRVEVGTALARGIRVIPVLVGDAVMPFGHELPEDLAGLARRSALQVSHETFDAGAAHLIEAVERALARAAAASADLARSDPAGARQAEEVALSRQKMMALAGRLVNEAERVAAAIADEYRKAHALGEVAAAVAVTDPDRAVRITATIGNEFKRAQALSSVAAAVAVTDPDRAVRITATISGQYGKEQGLAQVARAVAATDPDRAERVATSIPVAYGLERATALGWVAEVVSAFDPARSQRLLDDAERIASTMTEEYRKDSALAVVAAAGAVINLDRAQSIAGKIYNQSRRRSALADVAKAGAVSDPARAGHIADMLRPKHYGKMLLAQVSEAAAAGMAAAVVASDPGRAERIAATITDHSQRQKTLSEVAKAMAVSDPARAERIVATIDQQWRAAALSEVAKAVAANDAARAERLFGDAERIASSIAEEDLRVAALIRFVRTLGPS